MTTDKAPSVGEFVLVPRIDIEHAAQVCDSWLQMHKEYVRVADIERWEYPPGVEGLAESIRAAASPSLGAVPQGGDDWNEALDSLSGSISHNEAAGWEVELVRKRVQAALASQAAQIALLESDAERIASCPWRVQKGTTALCQPPRRIASQAARMAELEANDARYRWLRMNGLDISWNAQVSWSPGYVEGDDAGLDAAIDAAIKEQAK